MTEAIVGGSGVGCLETLTLQLFEVVKDYDNLSGNAGLFARKNIINIAKEIIRAVKEPGETPFEYSVYVRFSLHCNFWPAESNRFADGGNGGSPTTHGYEGLR